MLIMLKRLFAVLLLISTWCLGASAWAAETGSSFETATPIPGWGESFIVDKTSDDGYLTFDLKSGEGVTISHTALVNSGSQSSAVYAPGNLERSIRYQGYISHNEQDTISFTAVVSGTYYLKIGGAVGRAELAVHRAFYNNGVADADRSFFNSFNTARYLASGTYEAGELYDYHRFYAEKGDEVAIDLQSENGKSFNIYEYEYGRGYENVRSIYSKTEGVVYFTPKKTGLYVLRIGRTTGLYNLTVNGVMADHDVDNDGLTSSVEAARGLNPNLRDTNGNGVSDQYEAGAGNFGVYPAELTRSALADTATVEIPYLDERFTLHHNGGTTSFTAVLNEGDKYALEMAPTINRGDQTVRIYKPSDQERSFTSKGYVDDGEVGLLAFTAPETGTYQFMVIGEQGLSNVGLYRGFENADASDDQRDFHATRNTAKYLTSGEYPMYSDFQYHRFSALPGEEITIELTPDINGGTQGLYLYQPDADRAFTSDSRIYKDEVASLTFTPQTAGTYFALVTGMKGQSYTFNVTGVEAATLAPVFAEPDDYFELGGDSSSVLFDVQLTSPLKAGQYVALNFTDDQGSWLPESEANGHRIMECEGEYCFYFGVLPSPSRLSYRAGVFTADGEQIGAYSPATQCRAPSCILNVAFSENGEADYMADDGTVPMLGEPVSFAVFADDGYREKRNVAGTCPKGQWTSTEYGYNVYTIDELTEPCSVYFEFREDTKRRPMPIWLLTADE